MMLKPDGDPVLFPPEFFKRMSEREFFELIDRDGFLTNKQIRRLWRMTDRQGPPPDALRIMLKASDVMKCFPPHE